MNPALATTVTTSGSPSGFGQPVTFTATVKPARGRSANARRGRHLHPQRFDRAGVGTLSAAGIATFTTSGLQLPIGTHSISAPVRRRCDVPHEHRFGGAGHHRRADHDKRHRQPHPGDGETAITFSAHVAPGGSGSGIPTGEVFFTDLTTGKVLGSALSTNGNAFLTAHLGGPVGNHTVRAQYQGDGNNSPSSDTVNFRVIANGTRSTAVVLRTSGSPSVEGPR